MTTKIILANGKFAKQSNEPDLYLKLDFDLDGTSLLEYAINKVTDKRAKNILAIPEDYEMADLPELADRVKVFKLSPNLLGALATLAMLVDDIADDLDILILPVDSFTSLEHEVFLEHFKKMNCDAGLVTFTSDNPNYSYVRSVNEEVIEIAEKNVISSEINKCSYPEKSFI